MLLEAQATSVRLSGREIPPIERRLWWRTPTKKQQKKDVSSFFSRAAQSLYGDRPVELASPVGWVEQSVPRPLKIICTKFTCWNVQEFLSSLKVWNCILWKLTIKIRNDKESCSWRFPWSSPCETPSRLHTTFSKKTTLTCAALHKRTTCDPLTPSLPPLIGAWTSYKLLRRWRVAGVGTTKEGESMHIWQTFSAPNLHPAQ